MTHKEYVSQYKRLIARHREITDAEEAEKAVMQLEYDQLKKALHEHNERLYAMCREKDRERAEVDRQIKQLDDEYFGKEAANG